ncbi:hypothetical protein [Serinicoccus sp. LYQ131]|uniref:hypothetical protein n=1 Tax=Serinicoccus sp. LYQ131 TaxID=3378797 RepID=UPI003854DE58
MSTTPFIPQSDEGRRRTILRSDWVPCKTAFIDCRTPGSDRKDNYSFVGPGVSQSDEQFVNLTEPHGFNVGAAGMPNGTTNNLHLHFTAEVFINFDGDYLLRWGADGKQGTFRSVDGDVISVPPWIFRGFTNEGADEGVLLTVLGQDETGGIIWGPSVIEEAAQHGLYLSKDHRLIDTTLGQSVDGVDLVAPMRQEEIDKLDSFTEEQFATRVVRAADRQWDDRPFLCSTLPHGGAQLSIVIGYGLSEHRGVVPPLPEPHSFSLAWLAAEEGEGLLRHRLDRPQVLTARTGTWQVTFETAAGEETAELGRLDAVSVPAGSWRTVRAVSPGEDGPAELLCVVQGDERALIEWSDEVVTAAEENGYVRDANGYLAPARLLESSGNR